MPALPGAAFARHSLNRGGRGWLVAEKRSALFESLRRSQSNHASHRNVAADCQSRFACRTPPGGVFFRTGRGFASSEITRKRVNATPGRVCAKKNAEKKRLQKIASRRFVFSRNTEGKTCIQISDTKRVFGDFCGHGPKKHQIFFVRNLLHFSILQIGEKISKKTS
jgi:hypothetical protein